MNEALLLHLVSQLETTIAAIGRELRSADTSVTPLRAVKALRRARKQRSDKGKPRSRKRKAKQAAK